MNTINVFFDKMRSIFIVGLLIPSLFLWAYSGKNLVALALITVLVMEPISRWVFPTSNKAKWAFFALVYPMFLYVVIRGMNAA